MKPPSRVAWTLAAVFVVAALLVLLPTERFNAADVPVRIAAVLLVLAIAVVIGNMFRKRAVPDRGRLTEAEVIDLSEDTRPWKGEPITVWVARVRYRDAAGAVHVGIIDDCNETDCARLRPGSSTKIRYNERNPKLFLWTPDET